MSPVRTWAEPSRTESSSRVLFGFDDSLSGIASVNVCLLYRVGLLVLDLVLALELGESGVFDSLQSCSSGYCALVPSSWGSIDCSVPTKLHAIMVQSHVKVRFGYRAWKP